MTPGYEYLSVLRLTRVMQALSDERNLPQELKFVNRTKFTPAMDGEIIGRWINRTQIADLIADDAPALTYSAGKLATESTVVPNIKIGRHLTQEQLNQLNTINANPGFNTSGMGPNEIVGNIINTIVDDLYLDIMQRCEALLVGMHCDEVLYNRLGMKFTASWGMPQTLKVTVAIPWTDVNNATPVNDIWALKLSASTVFGSNFDRITMSTASFQKMIATAEFQAKARTTLPLFVNYANLPAANLDLQKNVAINILGVQEIELYDARFWSQDAAGNMTSAPFLPINKVLLSSTSNDNNPAVQDFANGITTESTVSGLMPNSGTSILGDFGAGMRGPIAYATVPPDLNPPNVTIWAVMRGFPRKFRLQASACMTVGSFTDTVPVVEVF